MMLSLISEVVRLSKLGMSDGEILRSLSGELVSEEKSIANIGGDNSNIIKKSSNIESSIVIPWCGVVNRENCHGLRLNHNLFTQCNKKRESESMYCKGCVGSGCIYGTVEDRLKVDEKSYNINGKSVVPYANVMKKLGIKREEAEEEAMRLGLKISSWQFEEKKSRRGRPPKSVSVNDTDSETSSVSEKKPRGRPKKEKKIVSAPENEDLIQSLIDEKKEESEVVCNEVVSNTESYPVDTTIVNEMEEEEDEDETPVIEFEIEGKKYLKSKDEVLYDYESHEAVGKWNATTRTIEEYDEEEEEEES
jgi:hypothetical protein